MKEMSFNILYLLLLQLLLGEEAACFNKVHDSIYKQASLTRTSFPDGFFFGSASSAFQTEGAATEGGRGPSLWDTYISTRPDVIQDQSNASVAADQYHRYKEDVEILKYVGFNAYRLSISWSRVLPRGNLKGGVNLEGVGYYNNLINELLSKGIQPFVTLLHLDPPQALEDAYGGFLSPKIVKDFTDYAELCFQEFGDRVKHWITINEPIVYSLFGYGAGGFPPFRCSNGSSILKFNCTAGDSGTEPYTVTHHQILAHASAVQAYRKKYQKYQKGQIGIVINCNWEEPLSESEEDKEATSRLIAFRIGWLLEPLYWGSYPDVMVEYVGDRLPVFSKQESLMAKGSLDFIGINYYSSLYGSDAPCKRNIKNYLTDACAHYSFDRNGVPIGPRTGGWNYIYPEGLEEALMYIKEKFNNPVIYIAENGYDEANNNRLEVEDVNRIDYIAGHLSHVHNSIMNGVDVRGYFVWSFLDGFEWTAGYTVRFGMVYVDYIDNNKRYIKKSAEWFKSFLDNKIDIY